MSRPRRIPTHPIAAAFSAAALALAPVPGVAQQAWTPPDSAVIRRARAILESVPLVDGHNDLPSRILERFDGRLDGEGDIAHAQPGGMTDLARLKKGGVGGQFWSAYVTVDSIPAGAALRHALREIDMVHRIADRYPQLEFARTAGDIRRIHGQGRIASLIGVEGGHAIENSLAALRDFYRLGVRYMTLTHANTTDWADAATDYPRHGGLTSFGEDVVREMNRLGIFVDLSHVAPSTMRDALRVSRAPVLFSHSSARALVDHPRNVPDDVLRMLPANGGVVMVTFVPEFVSAPLRRWSLLRDSVAEALRDRASDAAGYRTALAEWERTHPAPRATVGDVADHIDHVRDVAGIDHVGLGSDFDGIGSTPVGLADVGDFPTLLAELLRRGYSEEDVRKVAGLNLLRAMERMEGAAHPGG